MKVEIHISDEEIQEVIDSMCSYGLELTADQVKNLLVLNTSVAVEISEWGVGDTETNTSIINAICKQLGVSKDWPMYRNTEDYKKDFYKEFGDACTEHGYKWNSN
jgi:hypothetical protein